MKIQLRLLELVRLLAAISLLCCPGFQWAAADTHYVSLDGGNVSPYTNGWTSAATNIQSAIDMSVANDTVLVSNGVYQTGGMVGLPTGGLLTNRVVIPSAVTVQSLNNDPVNTVIKGAGPNGPNAVRCVYFRTFTSKLVGFTVTGGATLLTTAGNYEDGNGGGVNGPSGGTISNCIIIGNSGWAHGGGVVYCTTYNSQIISNTSAQWGGGQSQGKIYNSIIRNNTGPYSAGIWGASLYGCVVANNNGPGAGGANCYLYNCLFYGNQGAAVGANNNSVLDGCTLVGNIQGVYAEGNVKITILNSIIYSNTYNWLKYDTCVINFTNTCTTPAYSGWATGNITDYPVFIANGSGANGANFVPGNYLCRYPRPA